MSMVISHVTIIVIDVAVIVMVIILVAVAVAVAASLASAITVKLASAKGDCVDVAPRAAQRRPPLPLQRSVHEAALVTVLTAASLPEDALLDRHTPILFHVMACSEPVCSRLVLSTLKESAGPSFGVRDSESNVAKLQS